MRSGLPALTLALLGVLAPFHAAFAADAGTPAAPKAFAWDIPGVVGAVQVPGQQVTNGVPVTFDAFLSSWKLEALAEHFMKAFRAADLYVPPPADQLEVEGAFQITALDRVRMVSYTVILKPANTPDQTVVIAAQASLSSWNPYPEVSDIAPVVPGAEGVVRTENEGLRSVSYRVKATPGEVKGFYGTVMRAAGFQPGGEEGTWRKDGEEVSVRTRMEAGGFTGVLVHRRAAATPPPPPR